MKKHLLRDLMYFYTSVFSAGMRNIASQVFFDSHYPEDKETLVALSLFLSSVATMLGIMASSRLLRSSGWETKRNRLLLAAGMTAAVCVSFSSLFIVDTFIAYTALFCLSSLCLNFLYNVFDVFISGTVPPEEKEKNVTVLLSYQMAGYIIGPLFFSLCSGSVKLSIAITAGALLLCFFPVSREYVAYTGTDGRRKSSATAAAKKNSSQMSLGDTDNIAMFYSFMLYCATNILMPSVAYVMKDYLGVENYALRSSLFLAGTVLFSAAVIVLLPARKLWRFRNAAPLAMAAAVFMIIILRSSNALLLALAALLSGAGNGIFLSSTRYYVNTAEPSKGLVQRYNRIMTEATLTGLLFAAILSWICTRNGISVIPAKLTVIIILFAGALFFGLLPAAGKRPERPFKPS